WLSRPYAVIGIYRTRNARPRNLNAAFGRLMVRAGVRKIRFHDLRRPCATLLPARGISPRVGMDILGRAGCDRANGHERRSVTRLLSALLSSRLERRQGVYRKR